MTCAPVKALEYEPVAGVLDKVYKVIYKQTKVVTRVSPRPSDGGFYIFTYIGGNNDRN